VPKSKKNQGAVYNKCFVNKHMYRLI